ncbi:MAG: polyprenyl synthetase family protein [Opitutaceae bacterium]|jgi:octaprenyl-diphosphate synthase
MSSPTFTDSTHASTPLFEDAFGRLKPHMAELNRLLHDQIAQFEPEIREMADYCIDKSGKRIRPSLVFLSGWKDDGKVSPDHVKAAAVVELVHLATLVHDDIMDGAEVRRNRRTAAQAYGSAAAVLLGDALFSHALHLASQYPTAEICGIISASTRMVCAGEIIQTMRRGTTQVSREDYHRVIDLKTAELFRASCQLGSRLSGMPAEIVDASARFGRHLGIAYQIYDDLADFFGEEKRMGKTLGTDLMSGKLTLPLFILLERLTESERHALLAEIRGEAPPRLDVCLAQLRQHGVFSSVADAIVDEISQAEAALVAWPTHPPFILLKNLGKILVSQVEALRPKT